MTKIFLDTNVILDLMIPGREGKDAAQGLLDLREAYPDRIRLHLSFLSVADIAYILRKHLPAGRIKASLRDLLKMCQALGMSDMFFYDAFASECPDFEDALQIACAEADYCDFILTSNVRHFQGFTRIPVMTPADFLAQLVKENTPRT